MYLPRQLQRASYSWECNALLVITLAYPLKAQKVTWHLETATHTFASPVLPSPASSFTIHRALFYRFVLLTWKLLQLGNVSVSSDHGVTNPTSNSAQRNWSVTQRPAPHQARSKTWDCIPYAAVKEAILDQKPSRNAALRLCGESRALWSRQHTEIWTWSPSFWFGMWLEGSLQEPIKSLNQSGMHPYCSPLMQ